MIMKKENAALILGWQSRTLRDLQEHAWEPPTKELLVEDCLVALAEGVKVRRLALLEGSARPRRLAVLQPFRMLF